MCGFVIISSLACRIPKVKGASRHKLGYNLTYFKTINQRKCPILAEELFDFSLQPCWTYLGQFWPRDQINQSEARDFDRLVVPIQSPLLSPFYGQILCFT